MTNRFKYRYNPYEQWFEADYQTEGIGNRTHGDDLPCGTNVGLESKITVKVNRGIAQLGSASALGAEGRGFESLCPDQKLFSVKQYVV